MTSASSPRPTSGPPFRVTGGRVVRGGEPVLEGINLTVGSGEFLSLLGENGSGKTTLLRALVGLQPLTEGSVAILGQPVDRFTQWPRVGYVPQHLLASGAVPVSVREVVSAGLISPASRWRPRRGDHRQRMRTSLERVGLWGRRSDSFHTLSGGQQRRAMIAAALAKGADILLLDEPTAGVDQENVAQLHDMLADLSDSGATIVLVTHELGALADLVSRVVVLGKRAGASVLYDGPPPPPASLRDPHGHHDEPTADPGWSGA